MRRLMVSRRWFGQGLGASLTLPLAGKARANGQVRQIAVSAFAFAPDKLQITVGDTVVWINEDLAPHTATSDDGDWDTGQIEKGQTARQVFEKPGTFSYFCAFHPHMTGRIVVLPR